MWIIEANSGLLYSLHMYIKHIQVHFLNTRRHARWENNQKDVHTKAVILLNIGDIPSKNIRILSGSPSNIYWCAQCMFGRLLRAMTGNHALPSEIIINSIIVITDLKKLPLLLLTVLAIWCGLLQFCLSVLSVVAVPQQKLLLNCCGSGQFISNTVHSLFYFQQYLLSLLHSYTSHQNQQRKKQKHGLGPFLTASTMSKLQKQNTVFN